MLKVLLAGSIALGAVSAALAQQSPSPQPAALTPAAQPWTASEVAALSDARIAALKAGLTLRAEQEPIWGRFEEAVRAIARRQNERVLRLRSEPKETDPIGALRRRADQVSAIASDLRQFADIAEPLYRSLDDSQKRRMVALLAPRR